MPAPSQKTGEPAVIHLRNTPLTVSEKEAEKAFGVQIDQKTYSLPVWRLLEYIQNKYEDQGVVVVDHATGLMWQKSGSNKRLTYKAAQAYIKQLHDQKFAGYDNWRLPTIPELMSLLEPEKQVNDLYIQPIFNVKQRWCWSADRETIGESSSELAWLVNFYNGFMFWDYLDTFVRAVRS